MSHGQTTAEQTDSQWMTLSQITVDVAFNPAKIEKQLIKLSFGDCLGNVQNTI